MRSSKLDFSGASNIIDPFKGLRGALQQTSGTFGQMIESSDKAKARAAEEAYRRDALAIQQAQEGRAKDKYAQELADREANVEFAQGTLGHEGKTWMPTGDLLNKNALDITSKTDFKESDTPEQRAAKEKMQLGLSDWYDQQGQKLYESEKMADILAQREKAGETVTPDMLAALSGARKAELDTRQKQSDTALATAMELGKGVDKTTTELAKLRTKAAITSNKQGADKYKPIDIASAENLKNAISSEISPLGITLGEGELDAFVDSAIKGGYTKDEALKAAMYGLERGTFDDTFSAKKAISNLPAEPGSKRISSGSYSSVGYNPNLSELENMREANKVQATQSSARAAEYLRDPEELRAAKAQIAFDKYIAGLNSRNKPVPEETSEVSKEMLSGSNTVAEKDIATGLEPIVKTDGTEVSKTSSVRPGWQGKSDLAPQISKEEYTPINPVAKDDSKAALMEPNWQDKKNMATQIMQEQGIPWIKAWEQVEQNMRDAQVAQGIETAARELAQKEGIPYELAVQRLTELTNMRIPRNPLPRPVNPQLRQGN